MQSYSYSLFIIQIAIHLRITCIDIPCSIEFYGITMDPETNEYATVLNYASGGNLRNYLKNNFNNLIGKKNYFIYGS